MEDSLRGGNPAPSFLRDLTSLKKLPGEGKFKRGKNIPKYSIWGKKGDFGTRAPRIA